MENGFFAGFLINRNKRMEKMNQLKTSTLKSVFTAVFAALICIGSIMAVPIGPVPIVLQNAFAVLAGLLLGPVREPGRWDSSSSRDDQASGILRR